MLFRSPFDPDTEKDHLLLLLNNLSSPNAFKTLIYIGITLTNRSDIHKHGFYCKEFQIDKALQAFCNAWTYTSKVVSPVAMPLDIPSTPPTYDRDTVSPPPPFSTPYPTEFDAEMPEADSGFSLEDSQLPTPMPRPMEKGKWKPGSTPEAVCQAPIPPFSTPSLQSVTEVISPAVATACIRHKSQPLGEGARPPALGCPSMPQPHSGGLADSAWTETGMEASHTKGGKAKGKGKGETFAEVASKATSKPVGMEPPHRQMKITDTFKPAQTNSKPAKPPPPLFDPALC